MNKEIKHFKVTDPIESVLHALDEDAGVIIDNVMTDEQLSSIQKELKPYLKQAQNGQDNFTGFKTQRVGALIARSATSRDLAMHSMINQMAELFLQDHCDNYQLHFTSAINIGPGETPQILHRDRGVWGGYVPRKIETQFSAIWAITDFTFENGATQIVPGSHKWDKDREPMPDEIAYAEMKAKSVLIYTGSVLHGGGENNSKESRLGVFLHYAPSWLRQEENQYLSCPPEIAKDFSPELRKLIGYSKGGYVLGFYTDPNDETGELESVSPSRLFNDQRDEYSRIESASELVKESLKKGI